MNKYIEAEKLLAEIQRRKKQDITIRERGILIDIETAITSLQQEQPTKGYDEKYLNEKIAKAKKSWDGVDVDKYMDDVRGMEQQEQPEVDLEKELDAYYDSPLWDGESVSWMTYTRIARHFWNKGYNAGKEESK